MLLAGSMGALAQPATPAADTLQPVVVKEKAETPEGRDAVRAVDTTIGKGKQQLRDIPQSITVVTERLMDDRNLDRMEVLRGSASMLFGRGSTGGAVNLVSKTPRLMTEHQVDVTVGSHGYKRVVGDFNLKTGDSAALRIDAMATDADNNGAGSSLDKKGVAATYQHRSGVGWGGTGLMVKAVRWKRTQVGTAASSAGALQRLRRAAHSGKAVLQHRGSAHLDIGRA